MNKKKKIKKLLRARIDVWVDSLGLGITVKDACLTMDEVLRMCNAMLRLQEEGVLEKSKKRDEA